MTVRVDIYKHDGIDGWALEVVDQTGSGVVWQDVFTTDTEAMAEFIEGLKCWGLNSLWLRTPTKQRLSISQSASRFPNRHGDFSLISSWVIYCETNRPVWS